ncbi:uncharacterized protein [Miscanthus floridulus]|uniref:uncharacterized protein n=1 Tax=Miscanthus floridulus TaxID=154761 RepID=UPI003458B6D3
MYFNGSLTLEGVGVGVPLISPSGDKLRYALQLHFRATNNIVEYKALLHGIWVAVELSARCLFVRGDSELVINEVMKELTCHDMKMEAYYMEVRKLEHEFDSIELHHVLQGDNEEVDSSMRLASSQKPLLFEDAPLIHLGEGKALALASATSTST